MFHKLMIILILASVSYVSITAQMLGGNNRDSLLIYFVENKISYKDSDLAPSSTDFNNNRQSFPWLYLDQKQWENLSAYLDDPYSFTSSSQGFSLEIEGKRHEFLFEDGILNYLFEESVVILPGTQHLH
jgi:hypothetical protein